MTRAEGRIVKAVGGFFDVCAADGRVYRCRGRGVFKVRGVRPLVGDIVECDVEGGEGVVLHVRPRSNALSRPAVANVDQALVVCAAVSPPLSLHQLDRVLAAIERFAVPGAIVCTKIDLPGADAVAARLRQVYEPLAYGVYPVSAVQGDGLSALHGRLSGRVSVLAGASGVGKSTLIRHFVPASQAVMGAVNERMQRGRHTTTHVELYPFEGGFIADTPGFSQLDLKDLEPAEVAGLFRDLAAIAGGCEFRDCLHEVEDGCAVLAALPEGRIARSRYDGYLQLLREVREAKARRY